MLNGTKHNFVLFLDGFDEVLRDQLPQAKEILKCLVNNKSENIQLFVTTRPHMKQELEETLQTVAYNILPFQEEDQIRFLVKYWQQECGHDNREYLTNLAKSCLKHLHENMTDAERDVAGIPMQCMLLAEVNSRELQKSDKQILPESYSHNLAIFGMYKTLMDMRLEKASNVKHAKHAHILAAIRLLFPAYEAFFLKYLDLGEEGELDDSLYSIGILEKPTTTNQLPQRFIHRTFAEYLLAEFLVEVMKQASFEDEHENGSTFSSLVFGTTEKYIHLFKHSIFTEFDYVESYEFHYPVICYFINAHIAEKRLGSANLPGLNVSLNNSFYEYPLRFYKILAACTSRNFVELLSVVKECYPLEENEKEFLKLSNTNLPWTDLLLVAARYSSLKLLKEACNLVEKVREKKLHEMKFRNFPKLEYMLTPLHVSMSRGNYEIVEYLLHKYEERFSVVKSLLHFCVAGSSLQSPGIIRSKMQIIQLIHEKDVKLLNEKDSFDSLNRTPLFMDDIHVDLIKHLLSDANLYHTVTYPNYNIAHNATKYLTPDNYHELVKFLISKNEAHLFQSRDWIDCTPVHRALQYLDLKPETLVLLHNAANVDFNKEDKHGDTELFYAIRCGRKKTIIQTIVELGADWQKEDKIKQTVLHMAVLYGNLDAVEYFISLGANIEARDAEQDSPLLLALLYGVKNVHEVVEILIINGADIEAYDGQLRTAIRVKNENHVRMEKRTVELLEEAELKLKNRKGVRPRTLGRHSSSLDTL